MRLQQLFSDPAGFLQNLLLVLPALIIALSFHEFAHALAANAMGDNTPRSMGRLTISPFAHIDPIGFLMFLFLGFGYAKPVVVNPNRFKHRFWGELLVSIAGVFMNFILAVLFTVVFYLLGGHVFLLSNPIWGSIVYYIITVNISLMVFNLLPIPPLDGYRVVKRIFIGNIKPQLFWTIERYGFIIVLVLLASNILTPFLSWAVGGIVDFIMNTVGLLF
ncbi:site-2 protease family protein [Eubacteriales bacterium OttesenSCG-928-M02]|nr:site-2 protease family protein [Eubacteriales bacterium OttesenSCG-928-M02]